MTKTIDVYRAEDAAYVTVSGLLPNPAFLHSTFGVKLEDSMLWHWHMEGNYYAQASALLAPYGLNMTVTADGEELVIKDWEAVAFQNGLNTGTAHKVGGLEESEYPLSGEWAGMPTISDVYAAIGWPEVWDDDFDKLLDAWEQGYHKAYAAPAVIVTW